MPFEPQPEPQGNFAPAVPVEAPPERFQLPDLLGQSILLRVGMALLGGFVMLAFIAAVGAKMLMHR
jgi:hypothetical protein